MDLYAYTQIDDLEYILKQQNINIPRLRGLRLMRNEKLVSDEQIHSYIKQKILNLAAKIIEQGSMNMWSSSKVGTKTKQLVYDSQNNVVDIIWTNIHGRKRKWLKHEIKKGIKIVKKQFETFNSYIGKDVLYAHARIGDIWMWDYCKGHLLEQHPDYLDRAVDSYDGTYCDIYFKINGGNNNNG